VRFELINGAQGLLALHALDSTIPHHSSLSSFLPSPETELPVALFQVTTLTTPLAWGEKNGLLFRYWWYH